MRPPRTAPPPPVFFVGRHSPSGVFLMMGPEALGRLVTAHGPALVLYARQWCTAPEVVAHLWGGLTFEEVAQLAGCSSSTAHRWYLAGLAALRERLGVACPNQHPIPG